MIKLALIGLDSMGKNYFNTLASFKNARITHLCSKTNQTLESYPGKFIKTTDYKSLAIHKQIDGVIIATPASSHYQIAAYFLKQNIPLLIEKPLTANYLDAVNLLNLQKKTAVLVGHTLLYHPAYLKLKQQVSGIGKIKTITFTGANNKPLKDTSLIYDWGPHAISLFLDLLGKTPVEYQLISSKVDRIYGFVELKYLLTFPNAVGAFLKIGWNSNHKKRLLIIEGTKGLLVFDDFATSKLTLNDKPLEYDPTPPLTLELKDFINSLETGRNPKSSLKSAVKVAKVLDMLEKSAYPNLKGS